MQAIIQIDDQIEAFRLGIGGTRLLHTQLVHPTGLAHRGRSACEARSREIDSKTTRDLHSAYST